VSDKGNEDELPPSISMEEIQRRIERGGARDAAKYAEYARARAEHGPGATFARAGAVDHRHDSGLTVITVLRTSEIPALVVDDRDETQTCK
jgi:hypothetical protein